MMGVEPSSIKEKHVIIQSFYLIGGGTYFSRVVKTNFFFNKRKMELKLASPILFVLIEPEVWQHVSLSYGTIATSPTHSHLLICSAISSNLDTLSSQVADLLQPRTSLKQHR